MNASNTQCPAWAAGGHWLLTSASAKVDLVRRFRRALNDQGLELTATDVSRHSPALYEADRVFLSEPDDSPRFIDTLIEQCRRHDIRVILPTRDAELPLLARWRERLAESRIWVLAAPLASLELCQDKVAFHQWCQDNGLPVLPSLDRPGPSDFPVFIRPRRGAGGRGSQLVTSPADMAHLVGDKPEEWLIQPQCKRQEYTVDALFDFFGQLTQWVARERIRVEAGESKVSRTVQKTGLDHLIRKLGRKLTLIGPVTVQAFLDDHEGPWLIEVNPRLGGACALGIEAGLDTPSRLVSLVQGDQAEFYRERQISYGLTLLRYSDDLFVSEPTLEKIGKGKGRQ